MSSHPVQVSLTSPGFLSGRCFLYRIRRESVLSSFPYMKTKTIRQTVSFRATPHEVYEALMDSKKHAKFSRDKASISRKVGGKFRAYGHYIEGKNLELKEDKKIVQSWRAYTWPADYFSETTYVLTKLKDKTKLTFTHSGVPADDAEKIKKGWTDYYWKPMKEFLEKSA